jgi:CopA family copper-resistance protein
MLSDWTFHDPHWVFSRLKKSDGYFNYQQRTVADFFRDLSSEGWQQAWAERGMWGRMRMSSRDIADVTGAEYTYLVNGLPSESNWTGLFSPGEKVRLRFINGSAMTYFDVQIPGLKMTVVAADGQLVEPVAVDEFRIRTAKRYDVIVEPGTHQRAYTIFAEAMDRSGFFRATLAPREGMAAAIPEPRQQPVERGLESMGMGHPMAMGGGTAMDQGMPMDHGMKMDQGMAIGRDVAASHGKGTPASAGHGDAHARLGMHSGHQAMGHGRGDSKAGWVLSGRKVVHGPDNHGPGAAMVALSPQYRMDDPGVGLESAPEHKVLVYDDLCSRGLWPDQREPERAIELHLTGNMERYMWSFDGKKFSEVDGPIVFHHGERLRLVLVNDTMMDHPIHLHGMWMELENRHGKYRPRKDTINVKPGEMVSALITADAPGDWAFHCHLLYHMKAGMFRVVSVV